jgi:hypothetical protein
MARKLSKKDERKIRELEKEINKSLRNSKTKTTKVKRVLIPISPTLSVESFVPIKEKRTLKVFGVDGKKRSVFNSNKMKR